MKVNPSRRKSRFCFKLITYTLWISRCIAAARERIPGSIDNDVTGVSECSQQRGNLKDDGYISI
ncbi:hypothetical protein [Photorhabdus bodei]|uniref:Uncharacterized protein n=1 Tax=Photorhabdus bodei TaxID=2029681 RepID=A0AAW6BL93_9GAMM|nr:hypothetical protein [Photorhabdus bodei]MDB6372697.1 hypothetical protein [Photorhabdus bodei]